MSKSYLSDNFDVPRKCLNQRGHTVEPRYFAKAANFKEVEADDTTRSSKGDGIKNPADVDTLDMVVVSNFLNYARLRILADIDAANEAGDFASVALIKSELHAIDTFVRLVIPMAGERACRAAEEQMLDDLAKSSLGALLAAIAGSPSRN